MAASKPAITSSPKELLAAVVANAPIVLFAFDADGIFTLCEGRALEVLGRKPGESVGKSVFDLYAGFPVMLDYCRRALKGETLTAVVPVGPVTFETRYFPQLDWGGKVVGVLGIATDVSEAYRSALAKDEFLSVVSHELRTPLASASGWIWMLREGGLSTDEAKRAVDTACRNLEEIKRLIAQLRDASLVSTGRLTLAPKPCDLARTVVEAVDSLAAAAAAKNIAVKTALSPLRATVDKARVRQIAWNLVSNAVKFSPKGGTVEVSLLASGREVVLTVTDQGPGLPPSLRGQVFDLMRVPSADAPMRARGLGLGLSLSRRLAELHGGTIEVDSETGKGAVFTVRLPLGGKAKKTRP